MAVPRRQPWGSRRRITFIIGALAVAMCSAALIKLSTVSNCDQDVHMMVENKLNGPIKSQTTPTLSSRQSYGFFDDIPDGSWKLLQERARASHMYANPENPEEGYQYPMFWYMSNLQPYFTCPLKSRVKRQGDGPNYTCDPHRLQTQKDCLIYSIGSEGDYGWEDSLIDIVGLNKHCEIHVFGSGKHARVGDPASKNIHYHQWVMNSSYDTKYNAAVAKEHGVADSNTNFVSFPEMVEKLGHQNRTIDVLKMDCAQCEWASYKDWISADIRQILVEIHGVPSPDSGNNWHHSPMKVSDFFNAFTDNNFAMFSKDTNIFGGGIGVEFSYVKLHPDFWSSTGKLPSPEKPKLLQLDALKKVPILRVPPVSTSKIPPLAIFVHKTQILQTQDPLDSFWNTRHTISKFKEAWGETKASVTVLDDLHCLAVVHHVKEELVPFFRKERDKLRRTEMCRLAALYLTGGYYFAVDFELRNLTLPPDNVSLRLASVGNDVSKSFMASEPKNSIVSLALDKILGYYKNEPISGDPLTGAILSLQSTEPHEFVTLKDVGGEMSSPSLPGILDMSSRNVTAGNPVPIDMRGPPSKDFKIPRRMIFTSEHNILETKDPLLLYENVINTIQKYREAWGEPNAPVWFLDDADCMDAIRLAKVNLVSFYSREVNESWKADICRVAALYLTGGYSFGVDMEVIQPWKHDKGVKFATAVANGTKQFVQSFIASEKEGRVIKKTLSEMLLFYEKKQNRMQLMGPSTMKWAFDLVPISERGETAFLEETTFRRDQVESLERQEAVGCCCDLGVRDPKTKQQLFYSRIVGASPSCMPRGTPEGQVS